jgi:hypothetical protein
MATNAIAREHATLQQACVSAILAAMVWLANCAHAQGRRHFSRAINKSLTSTNKPPQMAPRMQVSASSVTTKVHVTTTLDFVSASMDGMARIAR